MSLSPLRSPSLSSRPRARMLRLAALVAALCAAAACGDDDATAADAGQGGDGGGAFDAGAPDGPTADAAPLTDLDAFLALLADPEISPDAIDVAMSGVAFAGGWPFHEGARWLFVRRWDDAPGDAALTGEWLAWAPAALPATRSASGAHVYVLIDTSAGAATPAGRYKWWTAGQFVAPPEARSYTYDEFGEIGWVAPPAETHYERFFGLVTNDLPTPRSFRVRVPAGLGASSRTLLLQDGQNVFDPGGAFGSWHADVALSVAAFDDVLAVGIDSTSDRFEAYTHTVDDLGGGNFVGGRGDAYWFLVDTKILPFLRATYGVTADGTSTAIVGSSLGGLITIYGAMTHPERARCHIAMSSTLGWGSFGADNDASLIERWAGEGGHAATTFIIDSGGGPGAGCVDNDADGVNDDGDDDDNYCVTQQFADVLRAAGYVEGIDLDVRHAPGAGHNEAAWAARLPAALETCDAFGWN